jgi:hypothetical protein
MKDNSSRLGRLGVFCAIACIFLTNNVQAVNGLTIQAQGGNIVLTWPSSSSATYIVQCRSTLDSNSTWQTLEASLPGAEGTTSYTDYDQIPQTASLAATQSSGLASLDGLSGAANDGLATLGTGRAALQAASSLPPCPWDMPVPSFGESMGMSAQSSFPSVDDTNSPIPNVQTTPPTTRFYRVLETGVQILGLTNNMAVSGVVSFPINFAYPQGTAVAFTLNQESDSEEGGGGQSLSEVLGPPTNGLPTFVLDTTMMSNGTHSIIASAIWYMDSTNEDGNLPVELTSDPMTINVYNEISFPNWMPTYGELGDSLLISAVSAHASADYQVDIYGFYDDYYYIGSFGGHTDNGDIRIVWNLTDSNGYSYNDAFCFDFVITTSYAASAGLNGVIAAASGTFTAVTPITYLTTDPWPGFGGWAVANQQAWQSMNGAEELDIVADGFVQGAVALGLPVLPYRTSGEAFRIQYGDDASSGTKGSQWNTFRSAIYNSQSRNLFYLGHGDPTGIGANPANTNVFISAKEIAAALHTVPAGQTNRHGYRFVFLDGCATAKGDLCEAFGIRRKENVSLDDYQNSATRPSAFLGWSTEKWIGITGNTVFSEHWNFIQYFQYEWANDRGVKEAISRASKHPNVPMINADTLKVYGYGDLHLNEFNR